MFTRTRKLVASLGAAALVIGGAAAVSTVAAEPAQAVSTCRNSGFTVAQATMCDQSWKLANMTPMSPRGIVNAGYEYCGIKQAKRSVTVARDAMKWHYGNAKGGALSTTAEAWLC